MSSLVLSEEEISEPTCCDKFSNYLVNDGGKTVLIAVWIFGCAAAFAERCRFYMVVMNGDPDNSIFGVLGHGITGARAAASVVKLNCTLLLITVLRNILSWIRASAVGIYLPVDKNIVFHRYCAWAMAFFSSMHTFAHMFNFNTIARANITDAMTLGFDEAVDERLLLFTTLPGLTGLIVIEIIILIFSSAMIYVRGPMFNVFWYTHHLFIVFFMLLCIHGGAQIFGLVTFWYWIILPAFAYTVERSIRVWRGNQDTILEFAIAHPSRVIELQMRKADFKYQSGQYLFLNCPYIAQQEWHPFTISSAPQEISVGVHIRIVGDWTGELWELLNPTGTLGIVQENKTKDDDGNPIFRIDGPYGAASEEIWSGEFKTAMLVGGGIGVTPFGSILKTIRYKIEETQDSQLQKVYFYWVSRDKNAFEWFSEILAALENDPLNQSRHFLEIETFLTGALKVEEVNRIMHGGNDQGLDEITQLQSKTNFGRPNWNNIFKNLRDNHLGEDIGVFFCGPAVLSKQLYSLCGKWTDTTGTGTKFVYHKENF